MIPPNFDSWGKIRVLREGFDVELVSNGWTIDLDQPLSPAASAQSSPKRDKHGRKRESQSHDEPEPQGSTVVLYESAVQDPTMDALQMAGRTNYSTDLEVETTDTQTFLSQQHKVLDMYRAKNEDSREDSRARNVKKISDDSYGRAAEPKVLEHIGPVQFNMGGIQVDADDMVQRLMVSLGCPFPVVNFKN